MQRDTLVDITCSAEQLPCRCLLPAIPLQCCCPGVSAVAGLQPCPGMPPTQCCLCRLPCPCAAGVVYHVLGTPASPNAAVLDVTGAGQPVGNQVHPTVLLAASLHNLQHLRPAAVRW